MKKIISTLLIVTMFSCCTNESTKNDELKKLRFQNDSLNNEIVILNRKVIELTDSLSILAFPSDQRYNEIVKLIQADSLDAALEKINLLKKIFPHSLEANKVSNQVAIIEKKKADKKAAEERRKALGFKVFSDKMNITINKKDGDVLKCSFSGFSFGRTFSFDYINDVDEYYYRTADKNNTYILANLSLSTKANYAYPPSLYACSIVDGKLERIASFTHEYATWASYGAYIGNYSETSHDFSKVSTVRYKLAAEISLEESKRPIIIIMFKNDMSNDVKIEDLDVDGVNQYCEVIRIINRNKI